MLITTKHWSSLDLGGVTFIFLELCPFIKGKLLNLPFPHTNFSCLNQILWNLYKCLLPPKTDQVQIWLASLCCSGVMSFCKLKIAEFAIYFQAGASGSHGHILHLFRWNIHIVLTCFHFCTVICWPFHYSFINFITFPGQICQFLHVKGRWCFYLYFMKCKPVNKENQQICMIGFFYFVLYLCKFLSIIMIPVIMF